MHSATLDETAVRGMIRVLDEMKAGASQLSMNALADALGGTASMARRGGGLQVRIRGLQDLMGSVRTSYTLALRKASVPEAHAENDAAGGAPGQ
jgi:hypothetical protein